MLLYIIVINYEFERKVLVVKSLIVYTSTEHKNTEKIAHEIASELKADLIEAEKVKIDSLKEYGFIGFGSGIFYGKFHKSILKLIDSITDVKNKKAFVFSTSGMGKVEYNNSLKEKLSQHGFEVIGSFACKGFDTFGPFKFVGGISKGRPNEEDLKAARKFAAKLAEKLGE